MMWPQSSHPSLLSSLVGNIRGLEKSEIPTQPIPFEAEDGMGGSWVDTSQIRGTGPIS